MGTKEILKVSQWLEYAQGEYIEANGGNILIEETSTSDIESDIECDESENRCQVDYIQSANVEEGSTVFLDTERKG